jgi:hypothetical protein
MRSLSDAAVRQSGRRRGLSTGAHCRGRGPRVAAGAPVRGFQRSIPSVCGRGLVLRRALASGAGCPRSCPGAMAAARRATALGIALALAARTGVLQEGSTAQPDSVSAEPAQAMRLP